MVLGQKLVDNGQKLGSKIGENVHNLGGKIKSHKRVSMPFYMPSYQDNTPKKSPLEK